ncbi:hypothetical protein MBM_02268 [Drepanopeziza brunnea f. sp. 'multigermtubi' MB_m1]|uniref:Cytochrome P450 n=1 Tax=Marssonina brunnea f. sp. multigermtubi (strain MB_m1) TaxID=1072389 RepID=K1X1C7_MARBU|nr:uncharacterized protein MBM_02268 [Drepanopeziza brunnea f. sp. 'multigermtubi' MB_m1]EKD19031.1 hypothetical protein MBM_02268 [Drepanopeziza brunnea f. sp. 'multigermtubi' MB_m1]
MIFQTPLNLSAANFAFLTFGHSSTCAFRTWTILLRFTGLWYFFQIYQGVFEKENIRLHKKYGPIVRIAPGEYSVDDVEVAKTIYGHGNASVKTQLKRLSSQNWMRTSCPTRAEIFLVVLYECFAGLRTVCDQVGVVGNPFEEFGSSFKDYLADLDDLLKCFFYIRETLQDEVLAGGELERHMLAFGMGNRTCIGKNISLLEMSKVVAQLGQLKCLNRWFVKQTNFKATVLARKAE